MLINLKLIQKEAGMARPIKETPTLYGKDAERFTKKIKENETKKVSSSEYKRAMENFKKIIKHSDI